MDDLRGIFESFDHKGIGQVSYTAWLAAALEPDSLASERAAKVAFEYFACDESGTCEVISKAELLKVLDEDDAEHVLSTWDSSGDGTLTETDFRRLLLDLARRRRMWEMTPSEKAPSVTSARTPVLEDGCTPSSVGSPGSRLFPNVVSERLFL